MDEKLEADIKAFLDSHHCARIAITDGKNPYASTMYYVTNGLRMYFETNPDAQKLHIISANPNISITVDEDYLDWKKIKGIQIFGKAKAVPEARSSRINQHFMDKFPHLNEMGGIPSHHIFIEVIPEKIYYMDYSEKFGSKKLFYVDERESKLNW